MAAGITFRLSKSDGSSAVENGKLHCVSKWSVFVLLAVKATFIACRFGNLVEGQT